jgi:hypothetical protein
MDGSTDDASIEQESLFSVFVLMEKLSVNLSA